MLNATLARLKIGTKILLIAGIALIGFVAILVTLLIADGMRNRVDVVEQGAIAEYITVQGIAEDFLNARRREKDFLLRKDTSFVEKHAEVGTKIAERISGLLTHASAVEAEPLNRLQGLYSDYDARFREIAGDLTAMGLKPDEGLLGKLRAAVHQVEDALKNYNDPQLTISMLMMRRHEKDFMARGDKTYIEKLTQERAHFAALLKAASIPAAEQTKLADLAGQYEAAFAEMAKLQLTIADKLSGMSEAYAAAEPILEQVRQSATERRAAAGIEMDRIDAQARYAMFGAVILIAVVMLALAFVIGRGISRPVKQLAAAMGRLTEGDKTVEVPVIGTDEVAQMAGAFSVFKASMIKAEELAAKEMEAQRQRAERARQIELLTDKFDQDVTVVLKAVTAATTEMQATASSMTATAEETARQATAVANASEEASTNVTTVSVATEELTASIQEISRQVQQSAAVAGRAVADADRTNVQVKGLADAAQKIGEVVGLINDIASQTNLLALNATIEAARAGEAGKGFAVVASEVKSLANQTAKATEEIGSQIGGIQQATGEAVSAIQSIAATIREINDIATAIASAVEEQGAATQEISRNVQQASAGTQEVSSNIAGVSDAAAATGAAAEQVHSAAGELSQQSETLRGQVETFLSSIKAA
ncbi:methyl-accepting chemotaxis protein [Dongia sedimenti]|uniref:Methyl-accepting chemotaxis protein n=1 Tax=Dongia sedimenti TaxID=3064282 RepID=A0ABU0YS80_9PROT|nr:methyl-accepting chemotaxis protein [Rhodospirillaceae bacterium R-7]